MNYKDVILDKKAIMDINQLAELLHCTPGSLKYKLYTNPSSLPPRIDNGQERSKPIWFVKIVHEWIEDKSRIRTKVGRPRKNVY